MKKALTPLLACFLLSLAPARALDLHFASGSVSAYTNVTLNLSGPTNMVVQVQRLNYTNDVWETHGTVNLTSGNLWQHNGTNVAIHLNLIEGFWLNKPGTNGATWTFQRNIW